LKTILILLFLSLLLINLGNQSFAQSNDKLVILHTNLGNIVIEFFPNDAPNHVANFIKLTESGFYDGTIFHRIIPGFMIQGGDPNTKNGDESTWGIGGPGYSINAEFNTIKHNRGIVSMARSQDPNSAGSQFFIVHKDSTFLDNQYTVFGRIVTEESFQTLDKIASVKTGDKDIPIDREQVKITKAEVVNRSDVPNLLNLSDPERTTSIENSSGTQLYENKALDIAFKVPEGWLLQEPKKTNPNAPDVVAVGPRMGFIPTYISLTVYDTNGKTLDDMIKINNELIKNVTESGINIEIISREKSTINEKQAYVTNIKEPYPHNGTLYFVQFKQVTISTPEKFYIFTYATGNDTFNDNVSKFDDSVNSFKMLSDSLKETKSDTASINKEEKGGGCLIATATYGSELAPQVQQLRELRDNSLLQTSSGTSFMKSFNTFYYSFSPTIADWERESPIFKEAVKITLTPMISSLSILNYVDMDSEAKVIGYGISLILLNVGMYFVAPAIVVYKIKKQK
jgi:peptidyl-prolyl cis-trans isomerase B (cyclophilin B)